uniref:3-beta hydroxysteroid dehydrogenase/isomerase domain-containing protein n=1 Tax=Crocodylus porosus TaxID=8502 RepID=A0A7M4EDL7_CROPO
MKRDPTYAMVTGGGGYFGYSLGCALAKSGVTVTLFDVQKPKWKIPNGVMFFQGDVRDYEAVFKACEGVDCVFHSASFGMSGLEQFFLNKQGDDNTDQMFCKQRSIPRLVYTSTVNVVFGGSPIEEGDEETVPYFPLEKQVDHYSRTKAIADQMILAANETPLKGGDKLHTCVIRPPGIYGPEEERHLPRVANIEWRLFNFKFGNPNAQMNWVHVGNLVQAHLLAAEALTPEKGYRAWGSMGQVPECRILPTTACTQLLLLCCYCSNNVTFCCIAIVMEYLHVALKPVFLYTYTGFFNFLTKFSRKHMTSVRHLLRVEARGWKHTN